jgi:hypothetical protein
MAVFGLGGRGEGGVMGPILLTEETMGLLVLNDNKLRKKYTKSCPFYCIYPTQVLGSPVKVCTQCSVLSHISRAKKMSKQSCYSVTTTFIVSGSRG